MTKRAIFLTAVLFWNATTTWAQQAPAEDRLVSGDRSTDVGLMRMTLTSEQKDKLRPLFEGFVNEAKGAQEAAAEKMKEPQSKLQAMWKAAQKDGTTAQLGEDPNYQALQEKVAKIGEATRKEAAARHERVVAAVMEVLTREQKRSFIMNSGPATFDPKRLLKTRAMTAIDRWAPGIDLPDEKYDPLEKKIEGLITQQDADIKATGETNPGRLAQWSEDFDKHLKQVVLAELSEEQRAQAATGRAERYRRLVTTATEAVAKSMDRLDPTEQQREKLAQLVAAARERMLKLDPESPTNWGNAYIQLRADVNQILTDEQRNLAGKPVDVKVK